MKLKYLALAGAMAFSTPAFAATVTSNNTVAANSTIATSIYNTWVSAWTSTLNTAYGVDNWANDLFTTFGGGGKKYLTGELYNSDYSFYQSFSWNSATKIASYNTPVAVPGPEAGAGLGALAMGGVAYILARRRKVAVAA